MVIIKMNSIVLSNDASDLEGINEKLNSLILDLKLYTKEGIVYRLGQIVSEIEYVIKFLGDHINGKGGVEIIDE